MNRVAVSPLSTYLIRRSLTMLTPLVEQNARVLVRERHLRAEAQNKAARLVTVRRWQRIVFR
jgi:hypothetical protein